jgi:hypothetical protein
MRQVNMKTIETSAVVGPDRQIVVQAPPDLALGVHRVVVVIDENPAAQPSRPPLRLSAYTVGVVSDTFTFGREDLYGDDGR